MQSIFGYDVASLTQALENSYAQASSHKVSYYNLQSQQSHWKISVHLFLAFAFGFLAIYCLYAGLPYDFNADILRDGKVTRAVSYRQLFFYLLKPATPAWFFFGRMEELRPFMYTLHKFFSETFGTNLEPVHVLVASAHGVLAVTFFLITNWITQRKLYSWLSVLLYATFPANAPMLAGYVSLEIQFLLSALELMAMAALVYLTWQSSASLLKRVALILFWIAVTWLAIKWKSSEKILPFVYLAFLILRYPKIRQRVGLKWWGGLLFLNLLMFILAVPLQPHPVSLTSPSLQNQAGAREYQTFAAKEKKTTRFQFANIFARTVHLPGAENPFFRIRLKNFPTSFTGNLGFFLGWIFWVGLLGAPLLWKGAASRARENTNLREGLELRCHSFVLTLLWFLAVVSGFANGQVLEEVRYLNYAFVPAVILAAFLMGFLETALFVSPPARKGLVLILGFSFLFTMTQNVAFLTKWVGHFGGLQHALYESEKSMYRVFFKAEPVGWALHERHIELENRVVLVSWYDLKEGWFDEALEKLKREGILFVKTRRENDERLERFRKEGFHVEKLASFPFYGAKPVFFRIANSLIRHGLLSSKDLQIIVYQVTR